MVKWIVEVKLEGSTSNSRWFVVMNRYPCLRFPMMVALVVASCASTAQLTAQENKKLALLIGVEEYERRGFRNLKFAEDDMEALGAALELEGFEVLTVLGNKGQGATRDQIESVLENEFVPRIRKLKKADIALIGFAGHGRHQTTSGEVRREDHYFCPSDAHDNDAATWISISELIATLERESGSENNLLLIDACRDNPSRGRGVDGSGFSTSKDAVAVFFASSYNEQAYEIEAYEHGLFTHYLLKGFEQATDFEGNVTWDSLVGYVKTNVDRDSQRLRDDGVIRGLQRPNSVGNLKGSSPVLFENLAKTLIRLNRNSLEIGDRSLSDQILDRLDQGTEKKPLGGAPAGPVGHEGGGDIEPQIGFQNL